MAPGGSPGHRSRERMSVSPRCSVPSGHFQVQLCSRGVSLGSRVTVGWSCPRNSSTVCVFSASSGPSRPTCPDCGYMSTVLILLGQTCCCLRTRVLLLFLLVSKWHWEGWSSPLGPTPSQAPPQHPAHTGVSMAQERWSRAMGPSSLPCSLVEAVILSFF